MYDSIPSHSRSNSFRVGLGMSASRSRHAGDFPTELHTRASLLVRLQRLEIPATEPAAPSRAVSNNRDCGPEQPLRSQTVPDLTTAAGAGGRGCRRLDGGSEPSHAFTAVTCGD